MRRPPREGFSWVDRRFLREYAARLPGDAILLYLFLAAVSDHRGLSYYSDKSLAVRLRLRGEPAADPWVFPGPSGNRVASGYPAG